MADPLLERLGWLPPPPADFAAACRALAGEPRPGRAIGRLAAHALDGNALARLGRAVARLLADGRDLGPLVPFRLGLVGNGTLGFLAPALVASAARHGIALDLVETGYDQVLQEVSSPDSAITLARPDAVLVALDHRGVPMRPTPGDPAGARESAEAGRAYLGAVRAAVRANAGAPCIVQTLAAPPEALFGHFDAAVPGTLRDLVARFNRALVDDVHGTPDVLFDVAALAESVGTAEWHSPAQYNLAKLPFADAFLPLYAEHVARLIGAMRGRSRRCLVLDLDNTLWGGVVGDDGLDGIRIAQGDATGEAHLAVQRHALALRERGIVLAVSSKNDDAVARSVFAEHPEMLLREAHLAVFQANWRDKATNIRAIAEELSLGLDALVFLDDNPAERALVREMLPAVAVPELPDDPALYVRTLAAAGYFEALTFSDEDRARAAMYDENARRVGLKRAAGDLDAYLASLDMVVAFAPFDATGRARISQLINKSNQFNLTTRRYGEAEVAALADDPAVLTLQVRLADRFGDNGMISVVVLRAHGPDAWIVDTWLMSCRVLGRGVERAVLAEILAHARAAGRDRLVGVYRPTERNGMVRDHYAKLGFAPTASEVDGETWWVLDAATAIEPAPMRVVRPERAPARAAERVPEHA